VADLIGTSAGPWIGFLVDVVLLLVIGGVAALLARRFIKGGTPPAPQMAIEEAKLARADLEGARSSGPPPLGQGEALPPRVPEAPR
jgi:hypothetical protein